MPCTKTGAQIYIEQWGEFAWCDAFQVGDVAYFRIVERSREPFEHGKAEVFYRVKSFDSWFDRDSDRTSTMISNDFDYMDSEATRKFAYAALAPKTGT